MEFVLRDLNFITCKELSSINAHLRKATQEKDFEKSGLYLHFLFGILSINVHIKDAYRELLHLEVFLNYVQANCAGKLGDMFIGKSSQKRLQTFTQLTKTLILT